METISDEIRGRGRPPMNPSERRPNRLCVSLTDEQNLKLKHIAYEEKTSPAKLAWVVLDEYINKMEQMYRENAGNLGYYDRYVEPGEEEDDDFGGLIDDDD